MTIISNEARRNAKALAAVGGAAMVSAAAWYANAYIGFDATKVPDGATVTFSGRTSRTDGGGGDFQYDATSVQPHDGAFVIQPANGVGRFLRKGWTVFGFTGTAYVEYFGAKGWGTVDDAPAINATVATMQAYPAGGAAHLSPGRRYGIGTKVKVPMLPDKSMIIEGNGAVVLNLSSYDGTLFYLGNPVPSGGFAPIVRNIVFRASTANATAMYFEWAGTSQVIDCTFIGFANGAVLTNSYAMSFRAPKFIGCYAGILATTYAHHLKISNGQFSGCVRDIHALEPLHNLTIRDTDQEGGMHALVMEKGGSALSIVGGYIEGYTNQPLVFGTGVYGVIFEANWFGFNVSQDWTNAFGARIAGNIFWDQHQVPGNGELDVGYNLYAGTSNVLYGTYKAAALVNGFENYGFDYAPAGYRKNSLGAVSVKAGIKGTVDGAAFYLPVGSRPAEKRTWLVPSLTGAAVGRVRIDPADGAVVVFLAGGTADLSCISFIAEA